jgi:Trk K+ transport system NAD-binding subunit
VTSDGTLVGIVSFNDVLSAYRSALAQNVRNVRSVGAGGSLVEAELSSASSVVGHTVAQTSWPREVVLVSIARGDRVIVPRGDVTMDAGDRLTIYTTPTGRDALGALLGVSVQEQTE